MTNELKLIQLAKTGDNHAFNQLIEYYSPKIKAVLIKRLRVNFQDLEDIIQVAIIKAWNNISSFRGDSQFLTWICQIARNVAINEFKKNSRRQKNEISLDSYQTMEDGEVNNSLFPKLSSSCSQVDSSAEVMEKLEELQECRQKIENTLNELAPKHKDILRVILQEGKTYKEASRELKIPIGTVMSRLYNAKKQAKKILNGYESFASK
jgi:RNA polymerase sigma-70 factor (ECF subfamily)